MNQLDVIGRQGIQSLPTEFGVGGSFRSLNEAELVDLRYVESPITHSTLTPMTSNLSLDGLERGKSSNLKPTVSFPDCSQGDDGGRKTNRNEEVRSSSFSVHPRNTSSKD